MRIIIEGPDNSGKTTLINELHNSLGIPIIPGEGPAKSQEEINDRVMRYTTIEHGLFDRHPVVSQTLYNHFRKGPSINPTLMIDFYNTDQIYIYCRGRASLQEQVLKDYDNRPDESGKAHHETVAENHQAICQLYDDWALNNAHFVYRIGDDFSKVCDFVLAMTDRPPIPSCDIVSDIEAFHRKFALPGKHPLGVLDPEVAGFRLRFLHEELNEYATHEYAAQREKKESNPDLANYTFHLGEMIDGLVDLVYVAVGTAYLHGFDFREAWRRVQTANMKKVRAQSKEESKRGSTFDVVKPEGWEKPTHIDKVEINDLTSSSS